MLMLFFVVCLLILRIGIVVPENESLSVNQGSQGSRVKNTGCELTYDVHAVFQSNALIFYSQLLIHNSLEDVRRLVSSIAAFTSQCCMHQAESKCFLNKRTIFNDRVCEDHRSLAKNQDIALCCVKKDPDRNACFQGVQSANMSKMYKCIPNWELCLLYIADQSAFVERQYRIFPPKIMAKIITESSKLYSSCCKEYAFLECFTEMEIQLQKTITTLINEGNKICQEYKKSGLVKTILWGIQYFTSIHPSGSITQAIEFANTYEQLSSNCCNITTWTHNCFSDESKVMLLHFFSKSNSVRHLTCYVEKGQHLSECFSDIASQEAQDIPEAIRVTPEQLCDIQSAYEGSLIIWYTYEYTRRHRNENLDVVLNSVSELESRVKHCCQETTNPTCFSEELMFDFSFSP